MWRRERAPCAEMISTSDNYPRQVNGDGPESNPKHTFNPAAKPFERCIMPNFGHHEKADDAKEQTVAYIGPTHLPVNTRIWSSISSYSLEDIARAHPPVVRPFQSLPSGKPYPAVSNAFPKAYYEPKAYYQSKSCYKPKTCYELQTSFEPKNHHAFCPVVQPQFGPVLLNSGVIQLHLRDAIVVEMTLSSTKVINPKKNVAISVSCDTTATALHHPNGVVFQNGDQVEIVACDAKKDNSFIRYAKMWPKGISFTSDGCAVIYLVDSGGTRTTSDMITMDLQSDYVNQVFFSGVTCGAETISELEQVVRRASYKLGTDGSLVYQINGLHITQGSDGLVKLSAPNEQCIIRTSPSNGSATVTTPSIHCTASLGATSHLFVRREERRMHFDGSVFIVRNAGHSAGFDEHNRLRVF